MTKKYKTTRQVTITGLNNERSDAFMWMYRNGYRLVYGGPLRSGIRINLYRFKIIANKVVR